MPLFEAMNILYHMMSATDDTQQPDRLVAMANENAAGHYSCCCCCCCSGSLMQWLHLCPWYILTAHVRWERPTMKEMDCSCCAAAAARASSPARSPARAISGEAWSLTATTRAT